MATKTKGEPKVKAIDNRGYRNYPFGFVYVGETRIGFSPDQGVWICDVPEWPHPTPAQLQAAGDALAKRFGKDWQKRAQRAGLQPA